MGRIVLIVFLLLLSSPAQAAVCLPLDLAVDRIKALGYHPSATGMQDSGHLIAVFVHPETRAWLMARKMQNRDIDYLCTMDEGQGWDHRKPPPAGKRL